MSCTSDNPWTLNQNHTGHNAPIQVLCWTGILFSPRGHVQRFSAPLNFIHINLLPHKLSASIQNSPASSLEIGTKSAWNLPTFVLLAVVGTRMRAVFYTRFVQGRAGRYMRCNTNRWHITRTCVITVQCAILDWIQQDLHRRSNASMLCRIREPNHQE